MEAHRRDATSVHDNVTCRLRMQHHPNDSSVTQNAVGDLRMAE